MLDDVGLRLVVGADNVAGFESADDVADGLTLADVSEEFVAETFTLACSCNKASDVDEFYCSWDDFVGVVHFSQDV